VFLAALAALLMVATAAAGPGNAAVGSMFGMVGLSLESASSVPQSVRNFRRRSARGLSVFSVIGWLVADVYKAWVFVSSGAPLLFPLCAIVQTTNCVVMLAQIAAYSRSDAAKAAARASAGADAAGGDSDDDDGGGH